jgi:FixJ family two-component response regulator
MGPYRILVIDDQEDVIEVIRIALSKDEQLELVCYNSPLKALESIQGATEDDDPYAMAIVDIMMPGMTGIEFMSAFEPLRPKAVTVNMSSHADLELVLDALSSNYIFDFIRKPILVDHLQGTVDRALGYYKLRKEREELSKSLKEKNLQLKEWNSKLDGLVKEKTFELNIRDQLMQHLSGCATLDDPFETVMAFCKKLCPGSKPLVLSLSSEGWSNAFNAEHVDVSPKATPKPNCGVMSSDELKCWNQWLNQQSEFHWGDVLHHHGAVVGVWLVEHPVLTHEQQQALERFSTLLGLLIYDEQALKSVDRLYPALLTED